MALRSPDCERGCARAREWASLRLDGELSELERLLLRRHLSRCEDCSAFAADLGALAAAVRGTPLVQPSRSLAPAERPARLRVRHRLAVAVLVVVAGAVGSLVGAGGGQTPGGPTPAEHREIAQLPREQVTPTAPDRPVVEPPGEPV